MCALLIATCVPSPYFYLFKNLLVIYTKTNNNKNRPVKVQTKMCFKIRHHWHKSRKFLLPIKNGAMLPRCVWIHLHWKSRPSFR